MKTINIYNDGRSISIKETGIECPYCRVVNVPIYVACAKILININEYVLFCQCSNNQCNEYFPAEFNASSQGLIFKKILPPPLRSYDFTKHITELSPLFTQIYDEAFKAEQAGLLQICGVGYRKSLEFLIKDYLIQLKPSDKERIVGMFLGKCIEDLIENTKIKQIAKRATWIGNDETHYVRKWEDKDVNDLKTLISITSQWIEMELNADEYLNDMPEKNK